MTRTSKYISGNFESGLKENIERGKGEAENLLVLRKLYFTANRFRRDTYIQTSCFKKKKKKHEQLFNGVLNKNITRYFFFDFETLTISIWSRVLNIALLRFRVVLNFR